MQIMFFSFLSGNIWKAGVRRGLVAVILIIEEGGGDQMCKVSWETDHHAQHRTRRLLLDWTQLRQQPLLTTVLSVVKGPLVRKGLVHKVCFCCWGVGYVGGWLLWLCDGNAQSRAIRQNTGGTLLSKTREQRKYSLVSGEPSRARSLCGRKIKGNGPRSISDVHRHVPCTKACPVAF